VNPLQVPQRGPYGEREIPTYRAFLRLNISFPQSPWYGSRLHVPHGQGYCVTRATGLFIYSFIHVCLPETPKRSPPTYIQEKQKVTVHRAPCRRKAYIQWGVTWFPKGIVNDTAVSTPVPRNPRHDTFHLGLGRSQSHCLACVVATPIRVYPTQLLPPPT